MSSLDKVKTHLLITGSVRSGTTAVCEFLSQSPNIIIPAEFAMYSEWDDPYNYMRIAYMTGAKANNRILYYKGIHAYSFVRRLQKMGGTTGKQSLEMLVNVCPNTVEVFGDKLPITYISKADKLLSMFDNLKIMIIMRDGRNVMESQVRRAKDSENDFFWHEKDIRSAESTWLGTVKDIEKLEKSDRILIYKYEDLLTNPLMFRECVSNFIETDVKMIENFFKPSEFDWRTEYPDLMNFLSDEFKEKLKRFGYE